MKRVFKYGLQLADHQEIELPLRAEILSVQVQHGQLMLWALVAEDCMGFPECRTIRIAGTGHQIVDHNLKFISTIQLHDGGLVFHVFEVLE